MIENISFKGVNYSFPSTWVDTFFFFLIDKKDVHIEKRKHQKQCPQSTQGVYKRSQKAQTEGEGIETKNITCPYLEPNQSMKLTSEEGLKTIDTLT